jgi:hypothetical protein
VNGSHRLATNCTDSRADAAECAAAERKMMAVEWPLESVEISWNQLKSSYQQLPVNSLTIDGSEQNAVTSPRSYGPPPNVYYASDHWHQHMPASTSRNMGSHKTRKMDEARVVKAGIQVLVFKEDLQELFILRRKEAARKLGVSETTLRKLYKHYYPDSRWPHRQVCKVA